MNQRDLLTTGEVARLIGSSRQHVVDLCNQGALPCVRAGTHRRIPRASVSTLLKPSPDRRERARERSLWLHRVVVGTLLTDPAAVYAKARANLAAWQGVHRPGGMAEGWLSQWERVLDQGIDAVADTLTSRSEQAAELRQNSPFAGVLDPEVRARALKAFHEHWRNTHDGRPAA